MTEPHQLPQSPVNRSANVTGLSSNLRPVLQPLLIVLFTAGLFSQNCAQAGIDQDLRKQAVSLTKILMQHGFSSATISVDGPKTQPSSGPAYVKEVLGAELAKLGIMVQSAAPVAISGKLKVSEVKNLGEGSAGSLSVQLDLLIVDRNDDPIHSDGAKIRITDPSEIARIIGLPFDTSLPGGGSTGKPSQAILDGRNTPGQSTASSTFRAKSDSPFGIQVLVNSTPRPGTLENGLAFVALAEQDEVIVRLVNDAPHEVAVQLMLDGIDCFWFTKQQAGFWLLPAQSQLDVKGWQLDGESARRFRIVPFERSVAAKAGKTGEVGVISASFFRSYENESEIPPEDRQGGPTHSLGFGEGDQFSNKIQFVDRKLGKIRACVPVRYTKPK